MIKVLDTTDMELAKNAYSQFREFGIECENVEVRAIDVPREIAQSPETEFMVIMRKEEEYVEQIVGKILDLENENYVEKLLLNKDNESREAFQRRAKSLTQEKAEKAAERLKNR